jgi:chemotaxis protein methyltransferase CheR
MPDRLSHTGFERISDFFFQQSGIRLKPDKRVLVVGRLARRAAVMGCSLDEYAQRVIADPGSDEAIILTDLLTTNETYFFREPQHFDHLVQAVRASHSAPFRVWSAASSSGEEGYSIALTLSRHAGTRPFEVVGTDLSTRMVQSARTGLYVAERCAKIPIEDLKRWCLKGEGRYQGQVLMSRELRAKVRFEEGNLMEPMSWLGTFDVIFLRNVLIYFEGQAKATVVHNVLQNLRRGGYFYTGHAESLQGIDHGLERVAPAIYRRVH